MTNFANLIAVASVLAGFASSADAATRLTFVGYAPPNSGSEQIPNWWMDQIEARTNGEVKFKRFPLSQLCKGPEIIDCVRDGRADVGASSPAYTPTFLPVSLIDSLPYMTSDTAAVGKALAELYKTSPEFRQEHEKLGLRLQLFWAGDPLLIGTNFEVKDLSSFAGKRVRGVGIGTSAFLSAIGAQPVALTTAEQYEALRTGVIDGYTNSFEGSVTQKLNEVTTHWYDPGFGVYATIALWVSEAAWQKLTPEQQEIVDQVTAELVAGKATEIFNNGLKDFCTRIKSGGTLQSFEKWPAERVEEARNKIGDSAYQQWAANVEKAGYSNPKGIYDQYVAALKAVETDATTVAQDCIATFK